jgi:4,5-DOPA dioxygenase extradiol
MDEVVHDIEPAGTIPASRLTIRIEEPAGDLFLRFKYEASTRGEPGEIDRFRRCTREAGLPARRHRRGARDPRTGGARRTGRGGRMSALIPAVFFGHGSPMNTLEDNDFTRSWREIGEIDAPTPGIVLRTGALVHAGTAVYRHDAARDDSRFRRLSAALFDVQYPAPATPPLRGASASCCPPGSRAAPVEQWGLDHGTWSVLAHAFPKADIPVVQLSIDGTRPPQWHFDVGRRLAELRKDGILIMGSGNIVTNLAGSPAAPRRRRQAWAAHFDAKIREAIERQDDAMVIGWKALGEDAQALSVPTDEHLLPLLYVLGARGPAEPVSIRTPEVVMGSLTMTTVAVHRSTHSPTRQFAAAAGASVADTPMITNGAA